MEAKMYNQSGSPAGRHSDRRRSPRSLLDMPLIVRGLSVENEPFREETFTISVNAHGALIALSTRVAVGQTLVLMDPQNRDEREGQVARLGSLDDKLNQVCVEFARPAPEFWQIEYPLGRCSVGAGPLGPGRESSHADNASIFPDEEWIKTLEDGRRVKFIYQELPEDAAFITAQVAGNEVVYSVLLANAGNPLSHEDVESHFNGELSKK
jgi:hypothetical protein